MSNTDTTTRRGIIDRFKIFLGKAVCDHMEKNGLTVVLNEQAERYAKLETERDDWRANFERSAAQLATAKEQLRQERMAVDHIDAAAKQIVSKAEADLATAATALAETKRQLKEAEEMLETADEDAAAHYKFLHDESLRAMNAIREAEGLINEYPSPHERCWWLASEKVRLEQKTALADARALCDHMAASLEIAGKAIHVTNVEHGNYRRCPICRGENGEHDKECVIGQALGHHAAIRAADRSAMATREGNHE